MLASLLSASASVAAQQDGRVGVGRTVSLFGDAGFAGGRTAVEVRTPVSLVTKTRSHVSIRGEGGIQTSHFAAGLGVRGWQLEGSDVRGSGWDGFILTELRSKPDSRTTLRAAFGVTVEDLGGPFDTTPDNQKPTGTLWSVGVGREVMIHGSGYLHLTADAIIPSARSDGPTRKSPVLELGVGYRVRRLAPIRPVRE